MSLLSQIEPEHSDKVVNLIGSAMNQDEASQARQCLDFYFACRKNGIDSSREYYIYSSEQQILGVVGLHHYRWGPAKNVWLSWFAVDPVWQGKGIGKTMLLEVEKMARGKGYLKFFIETYDHADFQRAIGFYQHMGFRTCGLVDDYLPDGSPMQVMMKLLSDSG